MILYKPRAKKQQRLFVSGTEFDQKMSQIVKGAKDIITIIFPITFRKLSEGAFQRTLLRSVILNEGIEQLEGYYSDHCYDGIFAGTQVQ